jgi:hypothetical protein
MKKVFLFAWLLLMADFSKAQWESDVRLTNNPAASWTPFNNAWCVAASGDTVHVVFFDNRDGNNEIYYKRSSDGGISWDTDVRLTSNSGNSMRLCVALSGPIVHVTWTDDRDGNYEIYYKRSIDRGSNWGIDTRLTNSSGSSFNPSMAVKDSFLHVLWYDFRDGSWEIYYKRSIDGGLSWEPDVRLTYDPADSFNASIAVSGTLVYAVWGDYRDGNGEIYFKKSSDKGASWDQDVRLTIDTAASRRPCISASGSTVDIVWFDKRDGDNEIYYKHSADEGTTWGADTRLTNSSGDSFNPSLAVSGSAVHVVWYDNRDGNLEIYYKRSEDEGVGWGADTRLTDAPGDSQYPSIAVSGPVVHVVWTDLRDGNEEIYYKRDPTGGFAVGVNNELTGNPCQPISIYPNPASTTIHIDLDNYSNEKVILSIRNILGEELLSRQIQNGESMIDVSNLQNGFYFVSLITNKNQVNSVKLIIAK